MGMGIKARWGGDGIGNGKEEKRKRGKKKEEKKEIEGG